MQCPTCATTMRQYIKTQFGVNYAVHHGKFSLNHIVQFVHKRQGRSKHLETGADVNTFKLHPLIN